MLVLLWLQPLIPHQALLLAAKCGKQLHEILCSLYLRTRGTEETIQLLEELLLAMSGATDTLGVPLLRDEIKEIWNEQKGHVPCLQDPPDVPLYTVTGYITNGGTHLPVLRCARGTISLESFHLHLARFIPGSSAGDINYQAYLLEGIVRWNSDRASQAVTASSSTPSSSSSVTTSAALRSFDIALKEKVHIEWMMFNKIKYTILLRMPG